MDNKVVFHLHEKENAVPTINNLLKDLGGGNVEIELLMNGTGVSELVKKQEEGWAYIKP